MDDEKKLPDDGKEFRTMEIMNKKLFFFDIDGTFLCEKTHEILPSTKKAYEQLLAQNHEVFLCTGRNKRDTLKIAKQLNTNSFISSNGQYIQVNNEEYFTRYISSNEKERYLSELQNVVWGYMTSDEIYIVENEIGTEKEAFTDSWLTFKYATVDNFLDDNVISIIIIDEHRDNYPQISSENNMYFWSGTHFQVVPNDINKGIGIQELVKLYNEDVQIYCFGDNDNDIQMFEIADVSVAMGNGTKEAQKKADYITQKASEDGIYNALIKLGVING